MSFKASEVMVPHTVREAAAYEDQDKVWQDVGGYNAAANPAAANSGTTVQIGLSSPEVEAKIKAALPGLTKELGDNAQAIGMIYILNGEIVSMDVFRNARTFQSAKNSLLHSYLADGAVAKIESKPLPSDADFKKFLEDVMNERKSATVKANGVITLDGSNVRGNEVGFGSGLAGGEKAPMVHGTYSKRK
jgi:hypothetical protein